MLIKMKMIIAIVEDSLVEEISSCLLNADYRVTQLATTGGFLRVGSTTLMTGVEDDRVEDALQIIRGEIHKIPQSQRNPVTLYVLNIKSFTRI
jgi:uncharacterized protein YaaQ